MNKNTQLNISNDVPNVVTKKNVFSEIIKCICYFSLSNLIFLFFTIIKTLYLINNSEKNYNLRYNSDFQKYFRNLV